MYVLLYVCMFRNHSAYFEIIKHTESQVKYSNKPNRPTFHLCMYTVEYKRLRLAHTLPYTAWIILQDVVLYIY